MTKKGTRPTHQKQLHFIYFVDAAQTRSFSLSVRTLWISIALVFVFLLAGSWSIFRYAKQTKVTSEQVKYILELKSALFSEQINHQRVLDTDFIENPNQSPIAHEVAAITSELLRPFSKNKREVAETQNVAVVSQTVAPHSEPKVTQTKVPKVPAAPERQVTTNTPSYSNLRLPAGAPISFEAFSISEDEPGSTLIQFDLQNVNKGKVTAGWVCAVVEISTSDKPVFRTAPSTVSMANSSDPLLKSCKGGEFVKFARLRPTELNAAASLKTVKRVILFFSETGSGRLFSQTFSTETHHANNK